MGRKKVDKDKANIQPKEQEKDMEELKKEAEQNLVGESEHPAEVITDPAQEPETPEEPAADGTNGNDTPDEMNGDPAQEPETPASDGTDNSGESEETNGETTQEPEAPKAPEETNENNGDDDRDEAEDEIESYLNETDAMKKQQILSVIKRMNYKLHGNVTTTFRGSPLPSGAHKNEYKVVDITPLKVSLKRGPYQISVKPQDIYPV